MVSELSYKLARDRPGGADWREVAHLTELGDETDATLMNLLVGVGAAEEAWYGAQS